VPQNFLTPQRDQPMLMPVDMRDWLPDDDLVFVVPSLPTWVEPVP
jgi:hypothetical protein